jgi:hypothetical protein
VAVCGSVWALGVGDVVGVEVERHISVVYVDIPSPTIFRLLRYY